MAVGRTAPRPGASPDGAWPQEDKCADGPGVVRQLVAGGFKLVLAGRLLGLTLAVAATRLLGGLLFEIDALDPADVRRRTAGSRRHSAARRLPSGPPRQPGQSRRSAPDRLSVGGPSVTAV